MRKELEIKRDMTTRHDKFLICFHYIYLQRVY